ncbi:hypothetical protein [Mucilaginibacter pedocola]|uniref:SGNH hydrolase-type esterase domain-containing protein n=1 Tax=Mucilaginibacter pedocola TaxID=1792845 RepID=A0A1S9PA73_9SPHI|nr:hypothetical protein [Mucilaginibacter pedocola]OOQ57727.1 hypothetical protein BC343_13115 [Mucilaginibacter pedocola]
MAISKTNKHGSLKNSRKTLFFKLFAVLLPFVIMGLLEVLLRLFHYGQDLSLFLADENQPDYLVVNPHLSQRYFTIGANATIGNAEPFLKEKPKGLLRFFVLGESTTIGFPYMHNGAFHRFLQYRLMQQYPEKQIEIINLALTAVNSFTVRDIAAELPAYKPDAVLIYCGHNEYYGALGVGSTSKLGSNQTVVRALIALKKLRVVQLLFNGYTSLFKGKNSADADVSKNLMERMAQEQKIPEGSEIYKAGIEQFADNMDAVCRTLSAKGVPVFLSTIVSNEKDLRPFISDTKGNAGGLYKTAQQEYATGNYLKAKQLFVAAKQADKLRFRAPEEINAEVIALTKRYPQTYLVDAKAIFEANSPNGIIGNSTLTEHVHPNLFGYALLSDAFYQALNKRHLLPAKPARNLTLQQLRQEMPITRADSAFGAYTIQLLKQRWPFTQKIKLVTPVAFEDSVGYDMAARGLKWTDAMDKLMENYQRRRDTIGMLKVAEAVLLEYPTDPAFYTMAGGLSAKLGQLDKAANYLGRAFKMQPSMQLAQELFELEVKRQQLQNALAYIDYGLSQSPQNTTLANVRGLLQHMIAVENNIRQKPNMQDNKEMARCYRLLGEHSIANKYASTKAN